MNGEKRQPACEAMAGQFVFYLCNELDKKERTAVDRHLSECELCRAQFLQERTFSDAIESMPQAADELDYSGILLSQCRSELAEKLDDISHPSVEAGARRSGWFRRLMVLYPAWSAGALVLVGLVAGVQATHWVAGHNESGVFDQAVNVRAVSLISDEQLSKMEVAGINITPAISGSSDMQNVRLQLSAEEPVVLTGSLDDGDVRRVLTYVVKNGERFNPGVRLDCLDALKARSQDKDVRTALMEAARKDQNPAVRLKALEALRDASSDRSVRQALLDTLQHDTNPGVRVEAVNLLVSSLETRKKGLPARPSVAADDLNLVTATVQSGVPESNDFDQSNAYLVEALQQLQRSDPSRYVRLQSSVALRQIVDRQSH
ncbi:MAG: HEAT repeat domain-containing protein [Candidatus Acidiferrum sp.]